MKKPIGYISYTHGLDGKIKIVPMVSNFDFEKSIKNNDIYVNFQDIYEKIIINIIVFNGKVFLCKINDIDNIEKAKRFLKKEIFIDTNDDDGFIDAEKLVGFEVFIEGEVKKHGKIIDFGNYGCGILIEVKNYNGKSDFYSCNYSEIVSIDYKKNVVVVKKRDIA